MKSSINHVLASLLLALTLPLPTRGQEQAPGPSRQQIRTRKLAEQWHGKEVIFLLSDGRQLIGLPVQASFSTITIEVDGIRQELPIPIIETAILRPGSVEVVLAILATALGGSMGYASARLAAPDAGRNPALVGAILGGTLTGLWGWQTFYREIRYDLKLETP